MSVTPASAIPDAIDNLVALLRADQALAASQVTILDGPPVSAIASPSTVLIVGGNGDEDDVLSVASELTDSTLRRGDTAESFDIRCHLEHWEGGDDVASCRRATFDALTAVKAVLVANPKLGGAVNRSRLTGSLSTAVAHFQGDTGCGVPFTIRCERL